jgi:hypothetical protein
MKSTAILILVLLFSKGIFAQAKIVTHFNKLPKEMKHGYKINFSKGKYSVTADTECSITVDSKNGYLKIFDNGTGGGNFVLEMAIFKTEKNKEIIAHNTYAFSGDGHEEGTIHFFDASNKMQDITSTVWPDMGQLEDLLPIDVSKSEVEPYLDTEYTYSVLPQKGTTINMQIGFKTLDASCNEENNTACALKKKLKPVKLVWNKKTISFDLKN